MLFIPDDALSTFTSTSGSRPNCWPISSASTLIRNPAAETRLFSALVAWPAPTPPQRCRDVPIACSTGSARSTSSSLPPIMIASSPLRARATPPETGASIIATPAAASRSARLRVTAGTPEVMSMTTQPRLRALSACSTTSLTSVLVGKLVTSTSAPVAGPLVLNRALPSGCAKLHVSEYASAISPRRAAWSCVVQDALFQCGCGVGHYLFG